MDFPGGSDGKQKKIILKHSCLGMHVRIKDFKKNK